MAKAAKKTNPWANWQQIGKKVAAMAAAPKAPAATAAPASENQPVAAYDPTHDSVYNQSISNINQNTSNLLGSLKGQSIGLEQEYGITGPAFDPNSYDPNNPNSGFSIDKNVDVTNPFSRAALLHKSYQQASRGDSNRMSAAGQLYSGAYQNAQNADTSNLNQGTDSLLKDFASKFGGLYGQWLANQQNATNQTLTAGTDAFNRYQAGVANGTITPVDQFGSVDNRPSAGTPDPNYNGNPNNLIPVGTGPAKGTGQPVTGKATKPKTVKPKTPRGTLVAVKGGRHG